MQRRTETRTKTLVLVAALSTVGTLAACGGMMKKSGNEMSFFVTSVNPGKGADFGGLDGADKYCQSLASAAGAGGKAWRAYLSTTGAQSVNARDRIGNGPWKNAKGEVVATDINQLHSLGNNLTKQTALTEKGEVVNGRGDNPNMHDILTGSTSDGRAMAGDKDTTCSNWTNSGAGSAQVGHSDRQGLSDDDVARSWNSSHATRGCGMDALKSTGGAGLLYCFAAN